jgi:hypothetical protein
MEFAESIIELVSQVWQMIFLLLFPLLKKVLNMQGKHLRKINKVINKHGKKLVKHETKLKYVKNKRR